MSPKTKAVYLVVFVTLTALYVTYHLKADGPLPAGVQQVTLKAKAWNNGKVHLWHDVRGDSDTTFVDIADGTSCSKVDDKTHKIGDDGPPIYYYKLNCNGKVGYVEIDQTR